MHSPAPIAPEALELVHPRDAGAVDCVADPMAERAQRVPAARARRPSFRAPHDVDVTIPIVADRIAGYNYQTQAPVCQA